MTIHGEPDNSNVADGVQVPSLSINQLDDKVAAYGIEQDGVMVYISDVSVGSTTSETENITFTGYYYYDALNNTWRSINNNSSRYLGEDYLGGIIFYIYIGEDGYQHGLVVSKIETVAQWQSVPDFTEATKTWDGLTNTSLMMSSPAKNWINSNFSPDWYLPSIDELSILWHNRFHVNKALETGSHQLLGVGRYWSSTESSEFDGNFGESAFFFNFFAGFADIYNKVDSYSVRAIRAF